MLDIKIMKKLDHFDLNISFNTFNEHLSILGASGAGKSMLLKCIAGIEKPDSGYINVNGITLFDGEKNINVKIQDRKIGYLFQDYALFPNMTVYKNIEIVLDNQNKKRIKELLVFFRIEHLKNKKPSELSGGQKQRVALARILALDPEVLLLDEPFSALDSQLKDELIIDLLNMLELYKKDIIIVTHNKSEAFQLTDKMMVINEGRNTEIMKNEKICDSPVYSEIAKMLGYKNITRVSNNLALNWNIKIKNIESGIVCCKENDIEILESYTENSVKASYERIISDGSSKKAIFIYNNERIWVETNQDVFEYQEYYLKFDIEKIIKLKELNNE